MGYIMVPLPLCSNLALGRSGCCQPLGLSSPLLLRRGSVRHKACCDARAGAAAGSCVCVCVHVPHRQIATRPRRRRVPGSCPPMGTRIAGRTTSQACSWAREPLAPPIWLSRGRRGRSAL